jgi:hypothetical protein
MIKNAFTPPSSHHATRAASMPVGSEVNSPNPAKGRSATMMPGGCRNKKSRYGHRPFTRPAAPA